MRYKVYGHTTVSIVTEVEADSEGEALEVACGELDSLIPYVGNGGSDKLIGVDGENDTVGADDCIQWTSAEEVDDD